MTNELKVLAGHVASCGQRIEKLAYSVEKNCHIFPLTVESAQDLTQNQEESIDALILRYSQCVAMIQDQIFRGIAYVEQEDLSNKSNRDKTLLMEKFGAIRSADEFGTAAILRNKFAHHYSESSQDQIERLNLLIEEAGFVIETFREIVSYLQAKGLNGGGLGRTP